METIENSLSSQEQDQGASVWAVLATYRKQTEPTYRGNPLIEALPPSLSDQEVIDLLTDYPEFNPAHRLLPANDRLHMLAGLGDLFQPFDKHLELYHRLSRIIRNGYVGRSIFDPSRQSVSDELSILDRRKLGIAMTGSLTCWGESGVGKSLAIEQTLSLFPQLICHSQYKKQELMRMQVVWLKLNWPISCTTRAFCLSLFTAADQILGGKDFYTQYTRRGYASGNQMRKAAESLCDILKLGLLVIDEVPSLKRINQHKGQELLEFIVRLSITAGVPIVLSGLEDVLDFFAANLPRLASARQHEKLFWERLKKNEKDWEILISQLWQYQYVRQPILLSEELNSAMYQATKGIIRLITRVFIQAQTRAITTGLETITPELIYAAADDMLELANLPAD